MELLSVLVVTYVVSGHVIESEMTMVHGQCMAAEKAITRSMMSPNRPTVELLSGDRVPVLEASCLPACPAGGEPLALLGEAA